MDPAALVRDRSMWTTVPLLTTRPELRAFQEDLGAGLALRGTKLGC
jgi:hypothetical protein